MWPWQWDLDWKSIASTLVAAIIGGLLTAVGLRIREARRKISFTAKEVYFGPTMSFNFLIGRECPQEDSIDLGCSVGFFNYKSDTIGLQSFRFEFCRRTYIGPQVELTVPSEKMIRDRYKSDTPYTLETVDLPTHKSVSFTLRIGLDRTTWPALRICDSVRLSCETPEGTTMHFRIASISFPNMPPEGFRGHKYMRVDVTPAKMPPDGRLVIRALRRQKLGPPGIDYPAEDQRYWSGTEWVRSIREAKTYTDPKDIRVEAEPLKLWHHVPREWQNDERE
jgi:hypothetical protein